MKRTIAIVAGGDSSELPVSLRSAQGIYSFIDKERYNLYIVEMEGHRWEVILPDGTKTPIDRNDFGFMENGEKKLFDFAYITIHGTPGENGILQGYFDLLGIPYSSCNVLVSAITFNKFTCNQYLKGFGIRVSESLILRKGFEITDQEVISKIGLPCFIKPNAGGSSFGVTKVKTEEEIQPSDMKEFQTLIKNLNAEQTVLNNRLIKTIDLIEKERELYKSNEKIREEKNRELSEKTQEAFNLMIKKSEELKELHQEKLEKALKEVENIKKYHMEMMRVLSQTVSQVERIDKLNWKDRVKQYAIQTGITLGAILIILGAYQLISLIK